MKTSELKELIKECVREVYEEEEPMVGDDPFEDEDDVEQDDVVDGEQEDFADEEPGDNMTDVEADADTLRSAGWGDDESYGPSASEMYELKKAIKEIINEVLNERR